MDGSEATADPKGQPPGDPKGSSSESGGHSDPNGPDATDKSGDDLERFKQLSRQWEQKAKRHQAALDALKEQVKGLVSPDTIQTKEHALTQAQNDLAAARLEALKYQVALEAGLPLDLAKRLVGTTEDELKQDATGLKALMKPPKGTPDMNAGTGSSNEPKPDANQALRMAIGLGR